ncbi:MAG TPA: hypothetical protein VJ875_11795 [Pyrinomonadaceae bacterium]|nr:hypothetical protein [Pyrinomonadaceae bacterium]
MKVCKQKMILLSLITLILFFATPGMASAPALPNPVLYFMGQEAFQTGGKEFIRYHFDVLNKQDYPDELFAASPELPPCGNNTKAARTWVDIYEQNGKRLNGFCALSKSADLNKLWFALEAAQVPPSWVYIELTDRKTGTKYKSNLADTTL